MMDMTPPAWAGYAERLKAVSWCALFAPVSWAGIRMDFRCMLKRKTGCNEKVMHDI